MELDQSLALPTDQFSQSSAVSTGNGSHSTKFQFNNEKFVEIMFKLADDEREATGKGNKDQFENF